ncbi:hypothetical protein HUE46_00360 [Flavobacterium columnare]|nr:hypothetical protein [Flavobacterium columnare]ANO48210.1 hypothetical protein Pf1_02756 [Flavobacterium columnare]MEB3800056.1 hypothetical protein [Flavobacterium columnare]QOG56231.1 hypothetical protein HUE29_01945 [Flavobacterium columnare]QOG58954.1 hypothetical protein HUE30_01945 [Flavobacterium columnare]QOG61676.1 hypothetical protein HUE31_01950 [Flavobacterium columnare]
MEKLYTNKAPQFPKIMPKRETVNFILSYSKALKIIKIEGNKFELVTN